MLLKSDGSEGSVDVELTRRVLDQLEYYTQERRITPRLHTLIIEDSWPQEDVELYALSKFLGTKTEWVYIGFHDAPRLE